MPEQPLNDEQSISYQPSALVEVLRRRLLRLEQAYRQLEERNTVLLNERLTLQQHMEELRQDLQELHSSRSIRMLRTAQAVKQHLQQSVQLSSHLLNGVSTNETIEANLDWPSPGATVSGVLEVKGWAIGSEPLLIEVWLEKVKLGQAEYPLARRDVIKARPWQSAIDCGFSGRFYLNPVLLNNGQATLSVRISAPIAKISQEIKRTVFIDDHAIAGRQEKEKLYQEWISRTEPGEWDLVAQRARQADWSYRPLISLITPVHNTPAVLLRAMLNSVLDQTYPEWELCLADGASTDPETKRILTEYAALSPRIKVRFLEQNLGIGANSNAALDLSHGEFVGLLDHDDVLSPFALYEYVALLNQYPQADLLYSDEDKLDLTGHRVDPLFKPDWSPELLESLMYIGHLGLYRASIVHQLGGFREYLDGSQDHDLALRFTEQTNQIYHIPRVLYHWRMTADSTALDSSNKAYADTARLRALSERIERLKLNATVEQGLLPTTTRLRYSLYAQPEVTIVIPTRDQAEVLRRCLISIEEHTNYKHYKVIVVNNDSHQLDTLSYFQELKSSPGITVLDYSGPFNYSAINNFAVTQLDSPFVLFLNNDTEVITPDWLQAMLEHASRPEVGAVGARLLYPNNTVQHAGVVLGVLGVADHIFKGLPAAEPGYLGLAKTVKNVSAVTGACLLTRTEVFRSVGGFDAANLAVAFNDVDFCLRLREQGLRIVWTPYVELYHYEALSRGADIAAEKEVRLDRELAYMFRRWPEAIARDPYYNPNLSRDRLDCAVSARCNGSELPLTIAEKVASGPK